MQQVENNVALPSGSEDAESTNVDDTRLSTRLKAPAPKRVTPQKTIMFDIPLTLRQFLRFPHLPTEIQDAIWEHTFAGPGINFMTLVPETVEDTSHWFIPPLVMPRSVAEEVAAEPEALTVIPCILEPVFSLLPCDHSSYVAAREQTQRLLLTSAMSQAFVKSYLKRNSSLVSRQHGILSVDVRRDVFFMSYVSEVNQHNGTGFNVQPLCAELDGIIQVAVRFNHIWKMPEEDRFCTACLRTHDDPEDKCHYPRHLYQFLARCFPSLEQVWIVDYFMRPQVAENNGVKKPRLGSSPATPLGDGTTEKKSTRKFACRGKSFFEADETT